MGEELRTLLELMKVDDVRINHYGYNETWIVLDEDGKEFTVYRKPYRKKTLEIYRGGSFINALKALMSKS